MQAVERGLTQAFENRLTGPPPHTHTQSSLLARRIPHQGCQINQLRAPIPASPSLQQLEQIPEFMWEMTS